MHSLFLFLFPKELDLSMRHVYEMVIGPESEMTEEVDQPAAEGC